MYQLDLGYWRFSAVFPVHSEIGKRSQYSNRESSLLYLPMRRAFSDQGASRITRTAVSIYNLVSVFGAAVATPRRKNPGKLAPVRSSQHRPITCQHKLSPSSPLSRSFHQHHHFCYKCLVPSATRLCRQRGASDSKLVIVECLSEWREFSKQFGGCWSMCSCFGKSGSPDG
jgi:hypothetical protein